MGVGQELTNGFKRVGHVFSFMLKQKKIPPTPHINNDRSLKSRHSATKDKFFHVKNVSYPIPVVRITPTTYPSKFKSIPLFPTIAFCYGTFMSSFSRQGYESRLPFFFCGFVVVVVVLHKHEHQNLLA